MAESAADRTICLCLCVCQKVLQTPYHPGIALATSTTEHAATIFSYVMDVSLCVWNRERERECGEGSQVGPGKKKKILNKSSHNQHLLLRVLIGLNGNWLCKEVHICVYPRTSCPGWWSHCNAERAVGHVRPFPGLCYPTDLNSMTGHAPDFITVPSLC